MMNFWVLDITDEEFSKMPYDRTHTIWVEASNEDEARKIASLNHDLKCLDESDKGLFLDKNRSVAKKMEITGSPRFIAEYGYPSG